MTALATISRTDKARQTIASLWRHHCNRQLLTVLACTLLTACGILTSVPDDLHDHPAEFKQFLHDNNAHADYEEFVYYLQSYGVNQIVPAWQLLQQGTDFRKHNLPRYALPDRENWDEMVETLIFLKYDLVPHIGDVRVLSGFRTPTYNRLAGGVGKSRHLTFSALDLQPVEDIDRKQLHRILQNRWHTIGEDYDLGMGLYSGSRFHIDTGGHRQW